MTPLPSSDFSVITTTYNRLLNEVLISMQSRGGFVVKSSKRHINNSIDKLIEFINELHKANLDYTDIFLQKYRLKLFTPILFTIQWMTIACLFISICYHTHCYTTCAPDEIFKTYFTGLYNKGSIWGIYTRFTGIPHTTTYKYKRSQKNHCIISRHKLTIPNINKSQIILCDVEVLDDFDINSDLYPKNTGDLLLISIFHFLNTTYMMLNYIIQKHYRQVDSMIKYIQKIDSILDDTNITILTMLKDYIKYQNTEHEYISLIIKALKNNESQCILNSLKVSLKKGGSAINNIIDLRQIIDKDNTPPSNRMSLFSSIVSTIFLMAGDILSFSHIDHIEALLTTQILHLWHLLTEDGSY